MSDHRELNDPGSSWRPNEQEIPLITPRDSRDLVIAVQIDAVRDGACDYLQCTNRRRHRTTSIAMRWRRRKNRSHLQAWSRS